MRNQTDAKTRLIVSMLIFLSLPLFAQTTYHVAGGSGLPSGPWVPGDSVLYQRGYTWQGFPPIPSSGTAGARVTYGAYGSGAKPIFLGGVVMSSSAYWTGGSWTNEGGNVWSHAFTTFPGRLWVSGVEYRLTGFTNATTTYNNNYGVALDQSTSPAPQPRQWWYDGDRVRIYATSQPSAANIYISNGTGDGNAMCGFSNKNYITLSQLDVRYGSRQFDGDGSSNWILDSVNCVYGTANYGFFLGHGAYCDSWLAVNSTFDRGDTVHNNFEFGGGPIKGGGNDAFGLGGGRYWEWRNCKFGGCRHSGIDLDDGNNYGGVTQHNWIHGCEFWGAGDYDRAILMNAINSQAGCAYNVFEDNYCHDLTAVSQIGGIDNRVSGNIIANQKYCGFSDPQGSWRSTMFEALDYLSVVTEHAMFWNNTFINSAGSMLALRNGDWQTPTRISVKNNLFINGGTNTGNSYCQNVSLSIYQGSHNDTIVNNIFYNTRTPYCMLVNQSEWGGGNTWRDVSYLNSFNGTSGFVCSGNVCVNPASLSLLIASNFTLPVGSPAIDAGLGLGLTVDYLGNPIPYGSGPDVGAIEYQGATVSPPGTVSLISPTNGQTSVSKTPPLIWHRATGATGYHVQVSRDSIFTDLAKDVAPTDTTWQMASPLDSNRTYWYRVQGTNAGGSGSYSAVWHFKTAAPTPVPHIQLSASSVGVGSPAGSSAISVTNAGYGTLTWSASSSQGWATTGGTNGPVLTLTFSANTTGASRVATITVTSNADNTPSVVTLAQNPAAQVPTLLLPTNAATSIGRLPLQVWTRSVGSIGYILNIDSVATFDSWPRTVVCPDSLHQTLSAFDSNKTFYWRVRGYNAADTSAWSSVFHFLTGAPVSQPVMDVSITAFSTGASADSVLSLVTNTGWGVLTWYTSDQQSWTHSTVIGSSAQIVIDANPSASLRLGTVLIVSNATNSPITIQIAQYGIERRAWRIPVKKPTN